MAASTGSSTLNGDSGVGFYREYIHCDPLIVAASDG